MCGQGGGGRGGGRERSTQDPWDSKVCSLENKAIAEPRCRNAGPRDACASLQMPTGQRQRRRRRPPGSWTPASSGRSPPDAKLEGMTEPRSSAEQRRATPTAALPLARWRRTEARPGARLPLRHSLAANLPADHRRQRPGFESQLSHLLTVRPGVVSLSSLHVAAPNCEMEQ